MNDLLRSMLTGTLALTALAMVALWFTIRRVPSGLTSASLRRLRALYAFAIACQLAHFAEEIGTGFQNRFPEFLGLEPWPASAFSVLNIFWLVLWVLSALLLERHFRMAVFPAWFLALAGIGNGLAHPLIALDRGGYFPGLWTAPLLGVAGVLLLRQLSRVTTSAGTRSSA